MENTTNAMSTIASTEAATKPGHKMINGVDHVYQTSAQSWVPTKKSTKKSTKPVAKKSSKPAAKKTAKPVAKKLATPRASSIFTLTAKAAHEDFGTGQRFVIAKLLKNGATRAQLIAKLPDVPPANISWHLSMMVDAKLVKKTAQK